VRELDILVIGAGDRIATDGVVVEGRSSLDTSAITGESIPVEVGPGDPVAAGSVNGAATLRIEATADGRDNSSPRSSPSWSRPTPARATGHASPTGSRSRSFPSS
jgi:P-type E1-E2 ATPase